MGVVRTFATVRLFRDTLSAAELGPLLDIESSEYHQRGEPMGTSTNLWKHSRWGFTSRGHVDSVYLEEHLAWLLEYIYPHRALLRQLVKDGVDSSIFCFVEIFGINSGVVIPPQMLTKLGETMLELELDLYPLREDPRGQPATEGEAVES